MSRLRNIFISGLVSFLPIALSIYIITAGINLLENIFAHEIKQILPDGAYIPGLGVIATLLLILLLGFSVNNFVTAAFVKNVQKKLTEIPLIKIIYSPLRDLMNLFAKGREQQTLQKVVMIHFTKNHSVIGLVTRESFNDLILPPHITENKIAVYIPMSYGLGGYTILVSKTDVESIDLPIEKAMSLALTGWIKTDDEQGL